MKLNLPSINAEDLDLVNEDTKILIKEFRSSLSSKYPCYNGAMLLFRPILMHFAADISHEKAKSFNEAIDALGRRINFNEQYLNILKRTKNIVNNVNHNYEVLEAGDEIIINVAWDFIKFMVEEVLPYKI